VAHLDEMNAILVRAQRFKDAVNAVARQTENRRNTPIDEPFDDNVRGIPGHEGASWQKGMRLARKSLRKSAIGMPEKPAALPRFLV
jgi:hypothetical protein